VCGVLFSFFAVAVGFNNLKLIWAFIVLVNITILAIAFVVLKVNRDCSLA
jgi:ABC-type multidrug transport system permease subunit